VSKPQRDFSIYPVRQCNSLHTCALCALDIRMGEEYHDGGYSRRAHVTCVQDQKRRAKVAEGKE